MIKNMKLGKKLALGFGIVILFSSIMGINAILQVYNIAGEMENLYSHPLVVSNAVRDIKAEIIITQKVMTDMVNANTKAEIEKLNSIAVERFKNIDTLFQIVFERFLGEKTKIEIAYSKIKESQEFREITYRLMLDDKKEEALDRMKNGDDKIVDELIGEMDYIIDFASNKADDFYSNAETSANNSKLQLMILFALAFIATGSIAYFITRSIRNPVLEVASGLRKITKGDLTAKISYDSKDEIGILAKSFDTMKNGLIEYRLDVESKIDYLNNIPTPIHVIDTDFNVLFINKAAEEMTNKSDNSWKNAKCYNLFNTQHCRTSKCRADQAMRTDEKCTGDTFCNPIGNSEIPIRYISSPLKDKEGKIYGAIEYIIDISDETKIIDMAERISQDDFSSKIKVRSDEDRLAKVLNSMSEKLLDSKTSNERTDWIKSGQHQIMEKMRGGQNLTTLAKGVINYISKRLNAQLGTIYLANEEQTELTLTGAFAYSVRKNLNNKIKFGEGLVGQSAFEKELICLEKVPDDYVRISSSLGDSLPKNIIVVPLVFEDKVFGVIELGTIKEFTDLEIEFLKNVSSSIAIAINSALISDKTNKLLEQTQTQTKELLEQQEELRATNEELEEHTAKLKHSEAELKSQQEELQVINEELEEKTESLEKQQDEIKKKNSALEEAKNVLEEKAKELEISSKYKSEFLANMSHELRTPLNSLLILSKNLADNKTGHLDNDEIESSEIIHNSGIDLLNLINDILDLSKIEAGKMTVNLENITVTEIVAILRQQFGHVADEKGINLNIRTEADIPNVVFSDLQKVNQILKNLISNAIKFTEEGSVTISLHKPEPNVHFNHSKLEHDSTLAISVTDTGIGIPESKQLEIFEAFQQVDGSSSRKFGGTGLGLSISRELAKLLGGEIQLESKLNSGSTFTLYIPLKSELHESAENGKDVERTYQKKTDPIKSVKIRRPQSTPTIEDDRESILEDDRVILVIEDDINFAKTLYQYCHKKDFKCIHAGDGETGLELAFKYIPDAIILDIRLPGIEGWSVLDQLKENIKTRHIPVHIMSAEESTIDAYKKGAMGQLTKPVKIEDLNSAFVKMTKMMEETEKRLLIVEDDENLRKTILKLVGGEDINATAVSTGKKAIQEISKGGYDCIILDLTLPDLSGFEVIEEMEKISGVELPPVIIYTGKELTHEEEYELNKHASSIIIKGVKSEERLLDETSMFLHQVVDKLPENKKDIISMLHDKDTLLQGKKILVVDDDMRNVFAVSKVLEEHGMIPSKAANGKKAVEYLEDENEVDLVLMDIMMPVMDGYEAMINIRKNNKFTNLPIIALTAKAMKDDREKCIAAGANDYLPKPLEVEKLLSLLRIWLYK
ncbi:MAG: response regulator [Melioribacteraceae bacterium]|nr:response regulator [Melioribacteraceae bacterium]